MKLNHKTYLFLLLSFFTFQVFPYTIDSVKIIQPTSPPHLVNDFANLLTEEQISTLENDLVAYNDSTSNQICIITIDTLHGIPIAEYALQVGRTWEIGQKGKDNGVLILISKNDREVDIEVGYGLEAHLTDYACQAIIRNSIVPNFKVSNYYLGIRSAVYSIKYFIQEYPATANYNASSYNYQPSFFEKYGFIFIMLLTFIIPFGLGIFFGWKGYGGSTSYSSSGWSSDSSSNYSGTSSYSSSSSFSYGSGGGSSFSGFGGGSFGGGGSSGKW